MSRWMMFGALLCALATACSESQVERELDVARQSEALAGAHAGCGEGRLTALQRAVRYQTERIPPYEGSGTVPAVEFDTVLRVALSRTTTSRVRFRAPASGEFAVYLGTPNLPLTLRRDGIAQTPVCSRYISPSLGDRLKAPVNRWRGAYVFDSEAQAEYELEVGPGEGSWAIMAVLMERVRSEAPPDMPDCDDAQLGFGLSRACQVEADTIPIRGRRFDDPALSEIEVGEAYGVHLQPVGALNEAAVDLTAPYKGDYLIALGTPAVELRVLRERGLLVPAQCGQYLDARVRQGLTGLACDGLRGAAVVQLEGGERVRIHLGRVAPPNQWVRLVVTPLHPDSDDDGYSDAVDDCPLDPASARDRDGDGLCDRDDNCASVANPEQTDSDADGQGDVCEGPSIVQIALGTHHACALADSGAVKCWGDNYANQLGSTTGVASMGGRPHEMGDALPIVDLGPGAKARAIAAGDDNTCALMETGAVRCWGWNWAGQLGRGQRDPENAPPLPQPMGDDLPTVDLGTGRTALQLAVGSHVCALLDDHSVKCWGWNSYGQLGLEDRDDRGDQPGEMGDALPTVDLGTGRTASAVYVGGATSCALLDNGRVKCWGALGGGDLGLGDRMEGRGGFPGEMGDALPYLNLGAGRTAISVAVGGSYFCALLDDGTVRCSRVGWRDEAGETGDALPLYTFSGRRAVELAGGDEHACAILEDRTITCWGSNFYGELGWGYSWDRGEGPLASEEPWPITDLGVDRRVRSVALGRMFSCALLDDREVKCWGSNLDGQLGLEDQEDRGDRLGTMGDALPALNVF